MYNEYRDLLDDYKDKDIILYCVVDVTSRATEKLLRERGFTKLHIGDGIKQYDYGKAIYSNALLSEFKYRISASKNKQFLNLGSEVLSDEEIKVSPDEVDSVLDRLDKSSEIFVYSDKPELSKAVCKKLGLDAFYNRNDYIESQDEKEAATCSA